MHGETDVGAIMVRQNADIAVRRVEHGRLVRDDIQLLRGVAVLSVLLYHAEKYFLPGGFLGVDIFFVLSGFLITRNIYKDILHGTFSYANFISQRFRRLLPACYAMLIFSAMLAGAFLAQQDIVDFLKQLMGTLSFSSNVFFWRQSGYFDSASAQKLLLHTWSLSLEEQYYLVLPPILYLGVRTKVLGLLVLFFFASMLACFIGLLYKPSAVFYLLPFRAWELLAGSICAVLSLSGRAPCVPTPLKLISFTLLICTLVFPISAPHPGLGALIVVLCTALLMVGPIDFGSGKVARSMYFVGDISYSLYLFHWPLFAVINHVFAGQIPIHIKFIFIILAMVFGYLSFRLVEQPFREAVAVPRKRVFIIAALAGGLVMLISSLPYIARAPNLESQKYSNGPNYGLSKSCAFDSDFMALPECKSSNSPTVLLWGDSYAMHLADALREQQKFGIVQATKSLCGPVPGVAPVAGVYNKAWAQGCISFNDSVLAFIESHPEIRLVIIGSRWRQYFNNEGQEGFLLRHSSDDVNEIVKFIDPEIVEASVRALASRITASGRNVIFVQPPPSADFDVFKCLQRKREDLIYIGHSQNCQISQVKANVMDSGLIMLLESLKSIKGIYSYSFNKFLCDGDLCKVEFDNVPLYRDEGHFSPYGSATIGQNSDFNEFVNALVAPQNGQ